MTEMAKFLTEAPAPYNPLIEFKKKDWSLSADSVKEHVLDNDAKRYKFTLKHNSGLELEISNDFISLRSTTDAIDPPSTKGKTIDEKYAHWEAQFKAQGLAFSTSAGEVNKGTFVEYANGGKHRVEVEVTASVDDGGKKSVTETLVVKGRQVECEMDHVQLFTTGPVQAAFMPASQWGTNVVTVADEDKVFKGLSDNATLDGPPTVHTLDDLRQADLYADPSYLQMKAAGNKLRAWAFPEGVNRTRQKAAYGLEMMGQIPLLGSPQLMAVMQPYVNGFYIWYGQGQLTVPPAKLNSATPVKLTLNVDEFPMKEITLKGNETSQEVVDAITKKLDECVLFKPNVSQVNGQTVIKLEPR
jgi:hypothetical protein